ncbi:hypothetical protein PR048_005485 [Dryococelus australis]|uniref:Uncharacterized protein n=1 Tax=Dryococelus australis TaxID=614101 RepID=A0ABQ9I8D5_9NEOP|nr:hypothetical protein PR048_005485 [Dryococelus australis]
MKIFPCWLKKHSRFDISEELVDIFSGVVGDDTMTCDCAVEKGKQSINSLMGKSYANAVIPRKARVKSLGVVLSAVKVRDNVVPVYVQQIFNIINCLNSTSQDLKEYFKYELSPTPLVLLKNNWMGK